MKKLFLLLAIAWLSVTGYAQTIVYHENFELPSAGDSVASSGNPGWNVGTYLHNSGLRSDSSRTVANDSTYLTTVAFSTVGYSNVILQFSHICKIEFFDKASIEVSNNNGATWTQLTTAQYLGTGFMTNNLFSSSSYTDWLPSSPMTPPTNAWWKTEQFDLSSLAGNASQVKVRFKLKDGNGTGAGGNWGWVIDDIKLTTAVSELVPPTITLNAPLLQDTVYTTGPFAVSATITDASGVQWAKIVYKLNGATNYDTVAMANAGGNIWNGNIPSFTYNKKIWYHVVAADNSVAHNIGTNPSSGDKWFYTKQGPTDVIVGTGTSPGTYPFYMNWGYTRSAALYNASEINQFGSITALSWNVSTATATNDPVKIYIKQVTSTTLTSDTWANLISGATLVYDATNTFTPTGWKTINLSTMFPYTSGNLLVLCESNYGGGGISPYPYFYYSTATSQHETFYQDNTAPTSSGTVGSARPNIKISFVVTNYQQDAGISQINEPTGVVLSGTSLPVKVTVKNFGVDTLVKATVKWKLDGVLQAPYSWTGSLLQAVSSTPVTIASSSFTTGSHTIKAWTDLPNDSLDANHLNDTTTASFYACNSLLNGTYTVGGVTADFPTFADAFTSLGNCGINGPVVFKINSGTYTGQLVIPEINGSSVVNTVTFMPNTGATVLLTSSSTTSTIKFSGADNVIFDGSNNGTTSRDMTIANTSTATSTAAIWMASAGSSLGCVNNVIKNCNINAGANTSGIYGIAIGGATIGSTGADNDNNIIQNNVISKAYIGIWAQGSATSNPGLMDNLQIIGNNLGSSTVADYLGHDGIILSNGTSCNIDRNTIFNIITNNTTPVGLTISTGIVSSSIAKNNINNIAYTGTAGYGGRGIYVNTGSSSSNLTIANNFISKIGGDGYTSFSGSSPVGMYFDGTNGGLKICYNSVYMSGNLTYNTASLTTAILFNTTSLTGIYLRNNIFQNTMNNTANIGAKNYAIYTTAPGASFTSCNNNDYYVSGTQGVLGYFGAAQATLAAWQTALGHDTSSVNVLPNFTSLTDLHTFDSGLNGLAAPIAGITDDIDGEVRNVTTPDIGADEFTPLSTDLGIISIVAPVASCVLSATENVTMQLKNLGGTPITTADLYYKINNGTPVHEVFSGNIAPNATYNYTFTQQANLSSPGNYTFKFYIALTGDQNILNDSVLNYSIANGWDFYSSNYTMGFEPTDDMSLWTKVDANADGYGWTFPYAGNFHSGLNSAELYNSGSTGNDWLFSRCFKLDAGSTYKIDFCYKSSGSAQNIDLKIGNNNTPAAMTTNLLTLSSFANTTYQKASITYSPTVTGSYNFGWWGHSTVTYTNAYIDDINISILAPQEASMVSMTAPVSGCNLGNENVTVKIANSGGSLINGNLTAHYKIIGGSTTISEAVTQQITAGDTIDFTFATTANLSVTTQDSTFKIATWIDLIGDPFSSNDSIITIVNSSHTPSNPTVTSDTVPYGGIATLQANSPDILSWYNTPTGGTAIATGSALVTPNLYLTTVYYAQANTSGGTTTWTFDNDLQGWTVEDPCTSTANFAWNSDGGAGALFASCPATYSYQLVESPSVSVSGTTSVNLSFNHRYGTESTYDEGYVAYKLDNGAWTLFSPTVNIYNGSESIGNDPLNGCVSDTKSCFTGTQASYITSSGDINTTNASNIQIAFVFTSDVSTGSTGWFINDVAVSGGMGGCASVRVPDTAYVQLLSVEAGIIGITSPISGCSDGTENISIEIRNNGNDTIDPGFTALYAINGGAPVSEIVNSQILPGDTLTYTFTTPLIAGLSSANADSTYHITSYIQVAGDTYDQNDTIHNSVTLQYIPNLPVVNNVTIPYGTTANLTAVSSDTVFWYNSPVSTNEIGIGSGYTTPVLYGNTVYYAEASTFTAGISTQVGAGTTSEYYAPCYGYYNYGWSGMIYQAGELNFFGRIDTIAFYVNNTVTAYQMLNQNIYMTETSDATFATADKPDPSTMSQVFTGNITWNGPGWYKIALQNPFTYSGSNNLMLYWENMDGSYTSGYPSFNYTSTTGNLAKYNYLDASFPTTAGTLTTNRPNITFIHTAKGCSSARVSDTVFVSGVPAHDAGVEIIYTPNSGIELSNAEAVKVRIKNYGTASISGFPVSYKIGSNAPVTETVSATINSNDTLLYTFTSLADLSAFATYNFKAYTSLSGDITNINDTAYKTIINNPLVYCTSSATSTYDCDISNVTFSNINNGIALPVLNNTSCVNMYTDFTALSPALLTAGMTYPISVSQSNDGSTFWGALVNVYLDYNRNGVWDLPQELVFSSPTSSTIPTVSGTFTVPTTGIVTGIPLRMRVVLDENDVAPACGTYSWGETEDYNVVISPQIPHDAGVISIVQPTAIENEGASVPVQVIVKNFGTDTIHNSSNMMVDYSLNGGTAVGTLWTLGNLAPMATATITLPNITVPAGTNNICAYTVLSGDSNTVNDQTCKSFYGTPLADAGVTEIIQPGSIAASGSSSAVKVVFKNYGVNAITSMNLAYEVNGGAPVSQAWTGNLAPNTTDTLILPNFIVPAATYNICSYTILTGDGDHNNDTLCKNSFGIFKDTLPYYDDFEGVVAWYDSTLTPGTVWELGTPAYGVTNSAHSPTNAWDVNLTTAYTNSATAYLYTQLFDFSNAVNAKLKFWQNRNVEVSYDGIRLEYSTDGSTWSVLGIMNDPKGVNWYNDDIISSSTKPGWTGNSNGWIKSEYILDTLNGEPNVQFRFVFNSDASGIYDGMSIDDISITIPSPIDAGVEAITRPIAQTTDGASVQVKVRIRNFGNDTLHNIPVAYAVNGGTLVTGTWLGYLNPNDTVSYLFPTAFTSPAGQYTICATTSLIGDGDHLNDTTCKSIFGIPTFNLPYTDNFEGTNYWLSSDGSAQWELGVPSSSIINTAHSPVNAWKTNLDGNYVANMNDNLYSPVFNLDPAMDTVTMSFWHWYDTQSGSDGGRVQYTLNGGTTWITMGYVGDLMATNWYTTNIGGIPRWSGSSAGWVKSTYKLVKSSFNNFNSPIQFRFNFFSDATTQANGWAVDDFSLMVPPIPVDGGVIAISQPAAATPMYSSVNVKVKIENFGTTTLSSIPVAYKVNAGTPVTATWTGTLLSGDTTSYAFATPYVSPATAYTLCAYTDLTSDTHAFNDSTCAVYSVTTALIDAGITKIIQPAGPVTNIGPAVTVQATIKNFGANTLTSIPVSFIVNGGIPVTETWSGTLLSGDSTDYTFTATYVAPYLGFYTMCVTTALSTDPVVANNKVCKTYNTNMGIEEAANNGIYLGQNMPNPASNLTQIDYYTPDNGNAKFSVLSEVGQQVYTESHNVNTGDHTINLDISKFTAGIYYYTLEFNGDRLYRKMIVVK
jgi:hypothetical protein